MSNNAYKIKAEHASYDLERTKAKTRRVVNDVRELLVNGQVALERGALHVTADRIDHVQEILDGLMDDLDA